MVTHRSRPPKSGLFFIAAFLALQAAPVAAADSGSGTFVGTIGKDRATVTFKDAYAFRAEDTFDRSKQVTLVHLSDAPMDKKSITAALRKARDRRAIDKYLEGMAYARLEIDPDGQVKHLYLFRPPGFNYNLSGIGKSEVKINTAKRVEGRYSSDDTSMSGEPRKIDLRFSADLADSGPPVKN